MAPSRYIPLEPAEVKEEDLDEVHIDQLTISNTPNNTTPPAHSDDSSLIHELRQLAKKQPKLVRRKKYSLPGQSIELTSWKMTEWMYTKSPCPFPTLARGLFTRWVPAPGHEHDPEGKPGAGRDQIVVRGYDKFFNMNEVKWNTVSLELGHSYAYLTRFLVGISCNTYSSSVYCHTQK
jgi:hypothetical protein